MKKVLFLFICLSLPILSIASGSARFGIKGGFYISTLQSDLTAELDDISITAYQERYTGYHLGIVGSFVFPGFFIQPELLWVNTGRDMMLRLPDMEDQYFIQEFHHLSLPLTMGMKVGPVKLGAGPVLSVLLAQSNDALFDQDVSYDLKQFNMGYQIGAGIQLGSIMIDLKYEAGLSKYGEGIQVGSQYFDFDIRPHQWIFSIGLLF